MPQAGRGTLRFPIFGFPVSIHPSFYIIGLVIALGSPTLSLGIVGAFTAIVLVSVLVHELGHAFAARGFGARPSIDLYIFGGVTAFVPPASMGRVRSIWVTLAGPLAGFALGGFVLSVAGAFGVDDPSLRIYSDSSVAEYAISMVIYVNIVWGFANLLPIMPLDGGNILRNLLPGSPEQRARVAAIISFALAAALVIWLWNNDYKRMITLPLLLGALNLTAVFSDRKQPVHEHTEQVLADLRRLDHGERGAHEALLVSMPMLPSDGRDRAKVTAVELLVRQGRGAEARRALAELPGSAHPSSYALVEIIDGAPAHGIAMLDDMFAHSSSPSLARYVLMARVLAGRGVEVPALFAMLPPGTASTEVLRELQHLAHVRNDFVASITIGEHLLAASPQVDPWVLYNIACSAARLGDTERALGRLGHAIDAGWTDAHQLDTDQDLAALWVRPEFRAIRNRLAGLGPEPEVPNRAGVRG